VIRVFKAPPNYYSGRETPSRFAGLRAINGFVVSGEQIGDAGWGSAPVRFVAIQSLAGKQCKFELPRWKPENLVVEVVDSDTGKALRPVEAAIAGNIASFATEAGATYMLYVKGKRPEKAWDGGWNRTAVPRFSYVGMPERALE
jgi:protein gp37